jgi:hypothetical protein
MGVETEYATAGPTNRAEALQWMLLRGRECLEYLPGPAMADMFLGNGSRIYLDCGEHPEVATPECTNPADVVRHIKAGERILERLCKLHRERDPDHQVIDLYRSNVDYTGTGTTWGCHESYLCQRPPREFVHHLVPHLVSRIVYTGAGGFNPLSAGLTPALSPRVYHLHTVVTDGSTDRRGIFHTKDESLADARYHRLHLICGESLHSHIATYLKCGATALVIALIDHGDGPGGGVQLVDPLAAMRLFTEDPTCRRSVPVTGGRVLSAVEIQRHYLDAVRARLAEPWMPAWAGEVCSQWGALLDDLERAPGAVQTRLDWAIKLALFQAHAVKHGIAWDTLPVMTEIAEAMAAAARPPDPQGLLLLTPVPAPRGSRAAQDKRSGLARLQDLGLTWADFERFQRLRAELFEIDLRCARLGAAGILAMLDEAGVLAHGAPGVVDIDRAVHAAPADTRAHVRGAAVRAATRRNEGHCTWHGIEDFAERRILRLDDPFATTASWVEFPGSGRATRTARELELAQLLGMLRGGVRAAQSRTIGRR